MNLKKELSGRVSAALAAAGAEGAPALLAPAARPEFGDYQANGVMAAAKLARTDPRELAAKVVDALEIDDLAEKVQVAGPGFVNITLRGRFLAEQLTRRGDDERVGVEKPETPQTVVVDYSHPNLAKEMHVGHLRSTIIGDAIVRVLEFIGHKVIRHNHVGDWGTQFGMLLAHMDRLADRGADLAVQLADLETFYQAAKERFDADTEFAAAARETVVRLQAGDEHCRRMWARFIAASLGHCQRVYDRLGVTLTRADVRPESAYNDDLPNVIDDLRTAGLLTESRGAQCVFLDEFPGKDGRPLPAIVQKSDGGYLYATTDLAAVRYRAGALKAERILYVVDARQTLHLKQVFAISRRAGFAPDVCSLEHHAFGTMMGADNRPLKTREGTAVKLMDLLDEAEQRASRIVEAKNPGLPQEQKAAIARTVGIGAVKYADLAHNRLSDYVFSWDKMLSLEGNTAPYMQYAYARIRSIFRKAVGQAESGRVVIAEAAERALGLKLLQFPETIQAVAGECLPNLLCAYLYDLARAFSGFYETCPVLKADPPVRAGRIALCDQTARTIRCGLSLLGIQTIEQM